MSESAKLTLTDISTIEKLAIKSIEHADGLVKLLDALKNYANVVNGDVNQRMAHQDEDNGDDEPEESKSKKDKKKRKRSEDESEEEDDDENDDGGEIERKKKSKKISASKQQQLISEDVALQLLHACRRIFVHFQENGWLKAASDPSSSIGKFSNWARDMYTRFTEILAQHWIVPGTQMDQSLQVAALRTLIVFVKSNASINPESGNAFGVELFSDIIRSIAFAKLPERVSISSYQVFRVLEIEYLIAYPDIQYQVLRNVLHICTALKKNPPKRISEISRNLFELLAAYPMTSVTYRGKSDDDMDDDDDDVSFEKPKKKRGNFIPVAKLLVEPLPKTSKDDEDGDADSPGIYKPLSPKAHRKLFEQAWFSFFVLPSIPEDIQLKILKKMTQHIIPYLIHPQQLCDFLTDAYNFGGLTSLLALSSLYVLIRDHNLDYPKFYEKLYALLHDPKLLLETHRTQFFTLLDLFLSSTHIPAYLVAAFAKRLCRIALFAPPATAIYVLPQVFNLLKRHPNCICLIHKIAVPKSSAIPLDDSKMKVLKPTNIELEIATGSSSVKDQLAVSSKSKDLKIQSNETVDERVAKLQKIREASILLALNKEVKAEDIVNEYGFDPYLEDEPDPAKSKALDSSLWELDTLARHYAPSISTLSRGIFETTTPLQDEKNPEYSIVEFSNESYKSLFDIEAKLKLSEKKKTKRDIPLTFTRPSGNIFSNTVITL